MWKKFCAERYEKQFGLECICLPSTSPANAAWNIARLEQAYALVKEADKKVSDFKGIFSKVLGAGSLALGSLKGLTGGFWKGVSTGMSIFKK